jgi:glycosyltransferase involved in cell wall biosynthesis
MKKILFIWEKLTLGGGEIALINLTNILSKKGIIVDLMLLDKTHKQNLHKIPNNFNQIVYFNNIINVSIFVRQYNAIILNDESKLSLIAILLKLFFKGKIIFWSHLNKDYYSQQLKNKIHQIIINKFALKFIADYVICVSYYSKSKMINYLNLKKSDNKIIVIYNFITYQINKDITHKISNPCKILTIGRLSLEKNFQLLIKAIIYLRQKYPIELTICGDGAERNNLQNLINQNNANDYIKLVGVIDDPLEYYQASDIFVSSSITESFSMVVIEALANKLPVIATNTGASEILEDNKYGIVIPIDDFDALVSAIEKLINQPELYNYYVNHGYKGLNKFNNNTIIQQWLNILK